MLGDLKTIFSYHNKFRCCPDIEPATLWLWITTQLIPEILRVLSSISRRTLPMPCLFYELLSQPSSSKRRKEKQRKLQVKSESTHTDKEKKKHTDN